jgi:hypothetical protein
MFYVPVCCPRRTLGTVIVYLNHPFDYGLLSFVGKDHPFRRLYKTVVSVVIA